MYEKKSFSLLCFFVFAVIVTPSTAWAYIDPGSGMLIWQGAIALIGGLLAMIRNPIATLRDLWQRVRRSDSAASTDNTLPPSN